MKNENEIKPERLKIPANLRISSLTAAFFGTAVLCLMVSLIMAIPVVPELLISTSFRSPMGWALAHMELLGWGTMLAMGASYQLIQVILNTRIYSVAIGWVQFALYTIGLVFFIGGFLTSDSRLLIVGGTGVTAGVVCYVLNITITLLQKKVWHVFLLGIVWSMVNLLLTVGLGCCLGLGLSKGWFSETYDLIFPTHLWLGLGGWLAGLIFTFSFKLLPMFYISGQKPGKLAYVTLISLYGGIWIHVIGLWLDRNWMTSLSFFLISASIIGLSIYANKVRMSSRSKQPIGAITVAVHMIPVLFIVLLLCKGPQVLALNTNNERIHVSLILIVIMAWFTPTILAYLSRIVPFLWWAYRFRTKEQKKQAVLLHNMLPDRRMMWELLIYMLGIIIMLFGLWLQSHVLIGIGLTTSFVAVGVYFFELSRVFRF